MSLLTSRSSFSGTLADADLIHLVDVSDTSQDAAGSSYKLTIAQLMALVGIENVAFVSATNGTASGIIGRMDRPYQTITQAQTAVSAQQVILIEPGTYSDSGLGKDSVYYFCLPGVTIQAAGTIWSASSMTYRVLGYGYFSSTGGDGVGRWCDINDSSEVYIEGYGVNSTNIGGADTRVRNGSILTLNFHHDIICAGYALFAASGGKIYAKGRKLQTGVNLWQTQHTDDVIFSDFQENILITQSTELFSQAISYGGGLIDIKGKTILEDGTVEGIGFFFNTYATGNYGLQKGIRHWGDMEIRMPESIALGITTSGTAAVDMYGKIINTVESTNATNMIYITGANVDINLLGECIIDSGAKAAAKITAGKLRIKRLVNITDDASAHGIEIGGGDLILDNATIVCENAAAACLEASSAQTVYSYNSFANRDKGTDITIEGQLTINENTK